MTKAQYLAELLSEGVSMDMILEYYNSRTITKIRGLEMDMDEFHFFLNTWLDTSSIEKDGTFNYLIKNSLFTRIKNDTIEYCNKKYRVLMAVDNKGNQIQNTIIF